MSDNFDEIYTRILRVTSLYTQTALAEFFEVRQSSISDAKKRGNIPDSWLLKLLREKSINPDWLLSGTGQKYLLPSDVAFERNAEGHAQLQHVSVNDLVTELGRRFADCRLEVRLSPRSTPGGNGPEGMSGLRPTSPE